MVYYSGVVVVPKVKYRKINDFPPQLWYMLIQSASLHGCNGTQHWGLFSEKYEILSILGKYGYNFRVITLMHITTSLLYIFCMVYVVNLCLTLWNFIKLPWNLNRMIIANTSIYMSWYHMKKLNYILILNYLRIHIRFQCPRNIWIRSKYQNWYLEAKKVKKLKHVIFS